MSEISPKLSLPLTEHYRLLIEDARSLSDRRETVNNLYVSIITLILGAAGYVFINFQDSDIRGGILLVSVAFFGILLATVWLRVLDNYKKLLDLRYKILAEWEERFPSEQQYYTRENKELYSSARPKKRRSIAFVSSYKRLPYILIVAFGAMVLIRSALYAHAIIR